MNSNTTDVANNLINTLGIDPCLLAIVTVVISFLLLMAFSAKQKEQIERERLKDALDAVERIVTNGK